MKKRVLVIGGSRFVGRVFSIQASKSGEFELHVVNRGHFPLSLDNVTEYKCDRHTPNTIPWLIPDIEYDAIIDFCAYSKGDISSIIEVLKARIKHYIYISTASVYAPSDTIVDENGPLAEVSGQTDKASVYINGKLELERELRESCKKHELKFTILRPTFIYGPFNYAQRESYFIEMIARRQVVPVPIDSTAYFNFVYVMDIARALMLCVSNEKSYDESFNLSGVEAVTYPQLISDFERYNSGPFETREVTCAEVEAENIPLPFPLTGNLLYGGKKFADTFEFEYTPFSEGMERTFKIFYSLYTT